MLTCKNVANFFLSKLDEEAGDLMSHMKLQKLVYYAQGVNLAIFDNPLFQEPIKAWQHGPVVPVLYQEYKKFGSQSIPKPNELDYTIFDRKTHWVLEEVYSEFGKFSGSQLRNMTHSDPPWKNTLKNEIITHELMKELFKTKYRWKLRWEKQNELSNTIQTREKVVLPPVTPRWVETTIYGMLNVLKELTHFKNDLQERGIKEGNAKMDSALRNFEESIIDVEDALGDYRKIDDQIKNQYLK